MEEWQQNKGKKPHKFTYTYQDIAFIAGFTYKTVRKYASDGKFNPNSLKDTIRFINDQTPKEIS